MRMQKPKIPQYRQLYEMLRKQIIQGAYRAGDILPSESELYRSYAATQPTVRQALALLVNDGYVKKHQGKGSIVQELPKGLGILSIGGRLSNSGNGITNLTTRIIAGPKLSDWPGDMLFTPSKEEWEQGCFYIERQRRVEETVLFYEYLCLPNHNLPRFAGLNLENKSFYAVLRNKYQIEATGGEQKLWAIAADEQTARLLDIKKGKPILRLERRIDTNRSGFSIYTSLYVNTEKYLLQGVI